MDFSLQEKELINASLDELEFHSILNFIARKCYSEPGKELIYNSRPEYDIYRLKNEHEMTAEMTELIVSGESLPFENYSDINAYLHKSMVENAVLSTSQLLSVAETIRCGRLIKTYFVTAEDKYPNLFGEAENLFTNRLLEKHIEYAIDDTGQVKDNATKELSRIRRDIKNKSAFLRNRLNKIMHRISDEEMIQEEFVTLREGRFVIPVKSEHKRHIPGIIHGLSQSGATVFLEPSEIIELNNEISLLINEEKREIYRILSNLTAEVGTEAQEFLKTLRIIAHFDAIIAKANYALEFGGVKPEINNSNDDIILKKIRHPLLVHSKGIKNVVPMSIEFDKNTRGHLISGPNAGGKTVSLKSVGLNLTMALSGIFPLGECRTGFMTIYTSIGDHQSIEQDLSTFSSQIIKLKEILSAADNNSLILIDEIGSGTDPQEGSALSAGILDTLIELNSYFIATTHNSALKSYALSRDIIRNSSLQFDEDKLQPTYNFLQGVPGNSYAFQLAKNLGLNELVLERARKYLGSKQSEIEKSISLLHKYTSDAERKKTEVFLEKTKAESIRKKYEEKFDHFKMKKNELISQANLDAKQIVSDANALIEKTIKEIKEEKKKFSEIKKEFNAEKKKIENRIEETSLNKEYKTKKATGKKEILSVGDYVITKDSVTIGTILSIDENKTALVDFNGIKFKLPLEELIKTEKKKSKTDTGYISFDAKSSCDVRGMRAYEAIPVVDELISNGLVANIQFITIIHGKGTGALRKAIHEFLDNHHSIKSYRTGNMLEGGDGITLVNLT
jgi:DNA mismatch repair protein MutS2